MTAGLSDMIDGTTDAHYVLFTRGFIEIPQHTLCWVYKGNCCILQEKSDGVY